MFRIVLTAVVGAAVAAVILGAGHVPEGLAVLGSTATATVVRVALTPRQRWYGLWEPGVLRVVIVGDVIAVYDPRGEVLRLTPVDGEVAVEYRGDPSRELVEYRERRRLRGIRLHDAARKPLIDLRPGRDGWLGRALRPRKPENPPRVGRAFAQRYRWASAAYVDVLARHRAAVSFQASGDTGMVVVEGTVPPVSYITLL